MNDVFPCVCLVKAGAMRDCKREEKDKSQKFAFIYRTHCPQGRLPSHKAG